MDDCFVMTANMLGSVRSKRTERYTGLLKYCRSIFIDYYSQRIFSQFNFSDMKMRLDDAVGSNGPMNQALMV
jgi:hypothetical protein